VSLLRQARHRAAAPRHGIVGVAARDDDLQAGAVLEEGRGEESREHYLIRSTTRFSNLSFAPAGVSRLDLARSVRWYSAVDASRFPRRSSLPSTEKTTEPSPWRSTLQRSRRGFLREAS